MASRSENNKSSDEGAPAKAETAPPGAKGKAGGWLPLILNIALMPVIAYGLTTFVLIPKIQGGKGGTPSEAHAAEEEGGEKAGGESSHARSSKGKVTIPLAGKILVNVSGTSGTRYLVANMTLVGKSADLKLKLEEHDPHLRDSAISVLGGKTITDLEKPGMRNIIRSELISAFNDILGKESITDIYFTEFAIQ